MSKQECLEMVNSQLDYSEPLNDQEFSNYCESYIGDCYENLSQDLEDKKIAQMLVDWILYYEGDDYALMGSL